MTDKPIQTTNMVRKYLKQLDYRAVYDSGCFNWGEYTARADIWRDFKAFCAKQGVKPVHGPGLFYDYFIFAVHEQHPDLEIELKLRNGYDCLTGIFVKFNH